MCKGEKMEYSVLSPRGEVDPLETIGLNPRVSDLNNKTIGLYTTFKEHWALILEEIARQLKQKFPGVKFTRFVYPKDLNPYTQVAELAKDPDYRPKFEKWLRGVDTILVANADAGSCTLYLTYNATLPERLGKPTALTVAREFIPIAKSAAALRGVPGLRLVEFNMPDLSYEPNFYEFINQVIPKEVSAVMDKIIEALTKPLTPAEKSPRVKVEKTSGIVHKGDIKEINEYFYRRGWSYGMPIIPPTEGAVKEMMTGTDLPPDYVVAKIPPMLGKATVEKIAVNAVMAGCLPTHMPVLIAAVKAIVDPRMWLEAYTCSVASWAPLLIVNGPIRKDLNMTSGASYLSPYNKANAAIGHATGLMIMNIAGIRPGVEDMGAFGHEGHFGICIAENEEDSPWEPLHQFYGFNKKDSTVSIFFPHTRNIASLARNPEVIIKSICDNIPYFGFDPGCAILFCPESAKSLKSVGYSRKDVADYVVEYARRSVSEINMRWMKGNYHIPKEVPLPADPTRSVRKFFTPMHLPVIVAGSKESWGVIMYGGGGDHGGPITKKIETPKNWGKIVAKYKGIVPQYNVK
jgi:hypothetical protein